LWKNDYSAHAKPGKKLQHKTNFKGCKLNFFDFGFRSPHIGVFQQFLCNCLPLNILGPGGPSGHLGRTKATKGQSH
jgi:hypothetical protein